MKALLLICLIAIGFAAVGSEMSTLAFIPQTERKQAEDSSLMKATDAAYSDAQAFAALLRDHGFEVTSIHRSKLESFFQGVNKAAFFRMDKGVIEVIFFPNADAAQRIQVDLERKDNRFIYTFRGQPQPRATSDIMSGGYPIYFITHGNAFVVTNDRQLGTALGITLNQLDKQ